MAVKDEKMVAALLREREAYVRAGKDDRVASVDKSLEFYGYKVDKKEEKKEAPVQRRSVEESRSTAPQGRTQRPNVVGQE